MINHIRTLITQSYEYISPDNLFVVKKDNIIANRDDILELYRRRRFYISEFRKYLTSMSTLIEEIEYCNNQLKRALAKSKKDNNKNKHE